MDVLISALSSLVQGFAHPNLANWHNDPAGLDSSLPWRRQRL